ALELALTGDSFTAEEAANWGFVNVLTEPGGALDAAITLAERIVDNAPLSVQASLAAVNAVLGDVDERGWDETKRAQRAITGTADAAEGVASFLERRPPQWQAR
ncbi:MAG: enoyl-CoA hydratase-related protein, partial [Ilumatobacteraceae bacterium]